MMGRHGGCAAIALVAAVVSACSSSGIGGGGQPEAPASHRIIYFLTGSASSADLTLQLGGNGSSQQQGVDVPLTNKNGTAGLRFTADDGQFLYISAQNNGRGTLHCRITEDGQTVDDETSSGQFSIVTCQGTA